MEIHELFLVSTSSHNVGQSMTPPVTPPITALKRVSRSSIELFYGCCGPSIHQSEDRLAHSNATHPVSGVNPLLTGLCRDGRGPSEKRVLGEYTREKWGQQPFTNWMEELPVLTHNMARSVLLS